MLQIMPDLRGEVRVTPWRNTPWPDQPQTAAYRIWQRRTCFGMFQAHEWRRRDGTSWREPWIPTMDTWATGSMATPDPDPDPLAETLELIARGHNDPRRLAQEALEAHRGRR